MSGFTSFSSAWEAEVHLKKKSPVYGYVSETLSSSMIKGAALGNFRKDLGFSSSPDLIMAVGTSLSVFSLDAPGMLVGHVSSAPVFANILNIGCLQPPTEHHHRSFAEPHIIGLGSDLCVVLAEDGQLALLNVEEIGGRYRLRTLEKTAVLADAEVENESLMLHKAVIDPFSRAITVVSWINHIELLPIDWANRSAAQVADYSQTPGLFRSRICIDADGAICDAAILSPLRSEMQRILLVAAVVERTNRHINLHLYESWVPGASHRPALGMVAKLPLPYSMSTPMYVVPLPDHRECFLLINECEIAFVSTPQILSGDVNIYHQPIPRLPNGQPDLVKAYCVAGTKAILSAHMSDSSRRPSEPLLSSTILAQKLYITTQSGKLYCVLVSPRPHISLTRVSAKQGSVSDTMLSGESMLFLGSHSHKRYRNADSAEASPDYLFVGGDCADHRIVRVIEDSSWQEPAPWPKHGPMQPNEPTSSLDGSLFWSSRLALVNQSPISDFMLRPEASYWTSGLSSNGAVNRAQFGHGVRVEETIGITNADASSVNITPTSLWSFALPSIAANGITPCVVVQQAGTYVPAIRDIDGEWQLMHMLHQFIEAKQLVSVDSVGFSDAANTGVCCVVCVTSESVFLVKSTAIALAIPEPSPPVIISCAKSDEVFTHGGILSMTTDDSIDSVCRNWILVAVRTKQMRSVIRIISAPAAEYIDCQMDQGPSVDSFVELELPHEMSCMRIVSVGKTNFVLVGTYEPKLYVFQLSPCTNSTSGIIASLVLGVDITEHLARLETSTVVSGTQVNDNIAGVVASDACVLCSADKQFLLIGLRNGSMVRLEISGLSLCGTPDSSRSASDQDTGVPRVLSSELIRVGPVPVVFTDLSPSSFVSEQRCELAASDTKHCSGIPRVLVLSESLFIASLSSVGTVTISLCVLHGGQQIPEIRQVVPAPPAWYQDRYSYMIPVDGAQHTIFCLSADASGTVSLLSIDTVAQCHVHEIPVGIEPRRVISDKETGLMLVAGIVPAFPTSTSMFPTSSLKAIDTRDGHIHAEAQFDPYELVHSLEKWHIQGPKSYRYICVGTGQYSEPNPSTQGLDAAPRAVGGRLVIYNLKSTKRKSRGKSEKPSRKQKSDTTGNAASGYELRYIWESKRSAPVRALAHLGDSYLILASGTLCVVLKLDVVQKQLIECCEAELRFPASSLDVRGNVVVVGSSRETVHVFRFVPSTADPGSVESLQMIHSARFGVNTADARCLANDLVVGIDTSGYLYAVGIPDESREFALDFIMGINLGTECTRVKMGSPVRRLSLPTHVLPWDRSEHNQLPGQQNAYQQIPEYSVIISTTAGALWTLIRISKSAYHVLHRLEQAMLDMEAGHPARPLMLEADSIARNRQSNTGSQLISENIVDGTLSRMFLENLTDSEQAQVLDRCPDLGQLALRLFSSPAPSAKPTLGALEYVRLLVHSLNSVCSC
ncbi:hypothetical protein GGF40_002984 [Coemansia sp. RSA 1286]|nr:hypothetical protein GGF40_002984 [Coemansia sp. RSA 1286]